MWKKVVAPTVFVSVLWIAVSSGTTFYINWLFESHARVLKENVATIQAAAAIQDNVWRLQALAAQAAETRDAGLQGQIHELEAAVRERLAAAHSSAVTSEEQALVKAIGEQFALYCEEIERVIPGVGPSEAGEAARFEHLLRLARAVAQPCRQLLEVNERLLDESTARSRRLASAVNVVRLAFLVAGPALGILFGIWVARGLRRSISGISVTLKDAAGELEREVGRIDIGPSDDLPALEQQVQAVSARIRVVLDELQEARREVIRAERLAAVGELAAGVAHELRNPLTSVKLLIQTAAQRQPERALGTRPYQVILEEITRMEETIRGLLDFARPSRLHRLRHDVRDTVRRAANLMEGRAKQERVTIALDLPAQPVMIDGDPEQLHQVFINLLLNGIESMDQGGAIQVELRPERPCARVCRIAFSDGGSGVPESIMDKIFEPFMTSKERGTGLGLAVSRRIVQEHSGRLTAANRPGGGAVFVVELPTGLPGPGPSSDQVQRAPEASPPRPGKPVP